MLRSINAWFFDKGVSPQEMADRCAQAGFEAIELTLGEEGAITVSTDEVACRRIAEGVRGAGLKVASLASSLFWKCHYASNDAQVRRRAHDLTLTMLDCAAWLGTDAILVVPAVVGRWDSPTPEVGYLDAMNRVHEALCELAPEAERRGVIIGIENVWNRFALSPIEMSNLIDRMNSPWVGAYFDVGNVLAFGCPEDWIAILAQQICRVHIKDYSLKTGGIQGFCPLGDGDVNWPAVMKQLAETGYTGPLTYEGRGDLADVKRRIDRIMALLT